MQRDGEDGGQNRCPDCGVARAEGSTGCLACETKSRRSTAPSESLDERRHLTVVFCDLVNSSGLSEALDLEDQTEVVREYRRLGAAVIAGCGGFVAQYLGDGLLAYFGYPESHDDNAQRAIRAGLGLLQAIAELSERWAAQGVRIQARVGIHAGMVLIGHEQLAVGSTVNRAARIQELAAPGTVLVTEAVHRIAHGFFDFLDRGERALKGFSKNVRTFEVRGVSGARDRLEAARSTGLAPFVNRERETALLRECWRDAQAGSSSVLLLGEPAIGKSRTLWEFRRSIQSDAPRVLEIRCSELHQISALFPLLELLRAETRASAGESEAQLKSHLLSTAQPALDAADKAAVLAQLLDGRNAEQASDRPAAEERRLRLEAILDWLVACASSRPALLIFDDMHWADATTLEVCSLLLTRASASRIMIVIAARPELEASGSLAAKHTLRLERLSHEHAEQLVSTLASGRSMTALTAQRIVSECDGVPLFLEEITRDALESSALASVEQSTLPLTLRDSLRARLDRLGPEQKRIAQQAAVLGREFDVALLCAAFALDTPVASLALVRLEAAGVLLRRLDRGEGRMEFRHALIHSEAYQSLTRVSLRDYHGRVASALRTQFATIAEQEPELLAYHDAQAGNFSEAVVEYQRAGQEAIRRSSYQEAVRAFTQALEELMHLPHSKARDAQEIDVRAGLGLALLSIKGFTAPDVQDVYRRGVELSEGLPETPLRILYGLWAFNIVRGDAGGTGRLLPAFEQAEARATTDLERLVTSACLGSHAYFRAEYARAELYLERASSLCDAEQTAAQAATLMRDYGFEGFLYGPLFLAWSRLVQGRFAECRQGVERALRLAEASKHPYLMAQALGVAAPIAHDMGEHARAGELADELYVLAEKHQLPYWQASALCLKGYALFRGGQVKEGIALLDTGLGVFRLMGAFLVYPYYLSYLVLAQLDGGELEQALATVDLALDAAERGLSTNMLPELLRLKGEVLASQRQNLRAQRWFNEAIRTSDAQNAPWFGLRATTSLVRRRLVIGSAETSRLAAQLEHWLGRVRDCPEIQEAQDLRRVLEGRVGLS